MALGTVTLLKRTMLAVRRSDATMTWRRPSKRAASGLSLPAFASAGGSSAKAEVRLGNAIGVRGPTARARFPCIYVFALRYMQRAVPRTCRGPARAEQGVKGRTAGNSRQCV